MQWWCSASATAWTWSWVAYPGVWLVVAALAFTYARLARGATTRTRDRMLGWVGVATIWLSLDWPLGPLAAGYLASVHAVQFLLVAMVAPPLLLLGARGGIEDWYRAQPDTKGVRQLLAILTGPLLAAILFNLVTVTSHVPMVVDRLMVTQLGAFAIDAAWLAGGLLFWYPLVVRAPLRPRFAPLLQMLYLFLGTIFHTGIAIAMLIRDFPMYRVYELAPPMSGLSAIEDIKIAGGIMELAGAAIVFAVLTMVFFRWARSAEPA